MSPARSRSTASSLSVPALPHSMFKADSSNRCDQHGQLVDAMDCDEARAAGDENEIFRHRVIIN
jgi:hypothetical protein